MKPIDITNRNSRAGGAYCSYYRITKSTGLKVLYSYKEYKSIKALKKSNVWRRATSESTMLKKCKERFSNIPATYGAIVVKCNSKFYAGILMQHIPGPLLWDKHKDDATQHKIAGKLYRAMKKVGIYHYDLHECNIIFNKETQDYWVIDFFPEFVDLLSDTKGYRERLSDAPTNVGRHT